MSDLQNKKIIIISNTSYKQPLKNTYMHIIVLIRETFTADCLMPDDLAALLSDYIQRYCIYTYTVIYEATVKRQSTETAECSVLSFGAFVGLLLCGLCLHVFAPCISVRLKQELFYPEKITCLPLVLASKHAGGDAAMSLFFVINIHIADDWLR